MAFPKIRRKPLNNTLTVQRLASALDKTFGTLIDMTDVKPDPPGDYRSKFLSRALAAFSLCALAECVPSEAAQSITDGYDDYGIDAIHFDLAGRVVYLVQSKWSHQGNGSIGLGDFEKFRKGVEALIHPDFSKFNEKVRKREGEIRANLILRSDVRVVLVLCYSSPDPLGMHISRSLEEFLGLQNNVGDLDVFVSEIFDLKRLYRQLSGDSETKLSFPITLRNWGTVDRPYRAYYGSLLVSDVAQWAIHGRSLFDKNLRYHRETEINSAIEATLEHRPEHFWYFNNGITILCRTLEKTVEGGVMRDNARFDCHGISIVNGAQTVGVIWELAKRNESYIKQTTALVHARMISLRDCPDGFGTEVTRAANTQNPIRHRDFAALDPEQHRLSKEMAMDQKRYAFMSGDPDPRPDDGCNIEDATVALACAYPDVSLAVQAKREVGQLWQDITKAPYVLLFNQQLTAPAMWRAVLVMRAVEAFLEKASRTSTHRGELIAIHGNRFIAHRVFRDPAVSAYRNLSLPESSFLPAVEVATKSVLEDLAVVIKDHYPKDYLATLFKNAQKNKALEAYLSMPSSAPASPIDPAGAPSKENTGLLFPDWGDK
jgi:hypothetical protein